MAVPPIAPNIQRPAQRIDLRPISREDFLTSNPRFFCIYTNEAGQKPQFVAAAQKMRGTALGAFYDLVVLPPLLPTRWLGKVGLPTGRFRVDDPNIIRALSERDIHTGALKDNPNINRTRTLAELNLDTIFEMIAYNFYQEFGKELFVIPNTFLSRQLIMNPFTAGNFLAIEWVNFGITTSLQVMCEMVPGYQDFANAMTSDDEETLPFMEFIRKNHRPPQTLKTPVGSSVPLLGVMELLAVIRALADTDGIGGRGGNAGFIWIKEGETIIAARTVKIDPGCAFRFSCEEEGSNRVINTVYRLGLPRYHLTDTRNIQIANNDLSVDINWDCLSVEQREIFLGALMNTFRYEEILKLFFHREGKFNRNHTQQIPEQIANELVREMREWLNLQKKIYLKDLTALFEFDTEQL